jgi:hypothetical protein
MYRPVDIYGNGFWGFGHYNAYREPPKHQCGLDEPRKKLENRIDLPVCS